MGDPRVLGADTPELRLSGEEAALLWPGVRAWAETLRDHGATRKLERLRPALGAWQFVARAWELRQTEGGGFAGETPNRHGQGALEPLAGDGWISTAEAAQVSGLSPQWIRALARRQELEARRVGREWLLSPAAVRDLAARRTAS
jgi:excisionase family DNA binding protein